MKYNFIFFILLLIYVFYHLITLCISPLPWFDEVVFASISNEFSSTGKFFLKAAPFLRDTEIFEYGPVYFLFTGAVIKFLGVGILQVRIISLVFGFLCFGIIYKLFNFIGIEKKYKFLCITILLFDPIFNSSMHGARMDTTALFFSITSLYFYLKNSNTRFLDNPYKLSILSGIFASLAILTTPRAVFILIPICLLWINDFIANKNWKILYYKIIWVIIIVTIYSLWFLYAFGSFQNLFNAYKNIADSINVGFFVPILEIPLIIISATIVLIRIVLEGRKYFTTLNTICILSIILFYFLVDDTGAYSVYISPFYVLLICSGLKGCNYGLGNILLYVIFLFYGLIFILKGCFIFSSYSFREPSHIFNFISANVPKKSKIIGDEKFYYSVIKNDCEFQFLEWYKPDTVREKYQREIYDYEYILLSKRILNSKPKLFHLYASNSRLIKVAEMDKSSENNLLFKKFGLLITESYDCLIYKRIK